RGSTSTDKATAHRKPSTYRKCRPIDRKVHGNTTSAPLILESTLTHRSRARGLLQARNMSALPPKADMCSANAHVREGPKADIALPGVSLSRTNESDCSNPPFCHVTDLVARH